MKSETVLSCVRQDQERQAMHASRGEDERTTVKQNVPAHWPTFVSRSGHVPPKAGRNRAAKLCPVEF